MPGENPAFFIAPTLYAQLTIPNNGKMQKPRNDRGVFA